MDLERRQLRAWLAARRAAEQREREEMRGAPLPPLESFRRAARLIALSSEILGWPLPEDDASGEEDREGYRRWSRLRAVSQRQHDLRLRTGAS